MLEKRKRLLVIESQIADLQRQVSLLEDERKFLLEEIYKEEATALNQLPSRAKNALQLYCLIDSDVKLRCFLDGELPYINNPRVGFHYSSYKKSRTYLERLMLVPGIGNGTAKLVLKILAEQSFF